MWGFILLLPHMLWLTCIFLLQHYVLPLTSVYCHMCCPSPSFFAAIECAATHLCILTATHLCFLAATLCCHSPIFSCLNIMCYTHCAIHTDQCFSWHVLLYLTIFFFYCHWMCCYSVGFSCCNIMRYHWLVLLLCCLSQSTLLPLKVLHFFAAGLYSATHFHFLLSALCVATLHILLFPFCTF